MYGAYRVEAIRAAEAAAIEAAGDGVLMGRAAAGLAQETLGELRRRGRVYGSRVLLAVGPGNNGGDALFAAATLARRGVTVRAWRTSAVVHGLGWAAFLAAGGQELDGAAAMASLPRADLVIDGVFGIGGRGGLPGPVARFASACRDTGVPVVAVDLPSGLPTDPPFLRAEGPDFKPALPEHFRAALTVTFGGHKLCHVLQPARSRCGRIELVDIGLEMGGPAVRCWEPGDLAAAWPVPDESSDKYGRGVVGIDAGSVRYPGAGVLVTLGAVHAGAGFVRYTGAPTVAALINQRLPNVVIGEGRVSARVLGSGWGDRADGPQVVAGAIHSGLPVVIDADALGFLPASGCHERVLLTPHAGELARLLGGDRDEVEADPLAAVAAAARTTGATVLLKGATQYVATPGRSTVDIAVPGPAWTAQAGSGDVLAGICGTLLAAGLQTATAAAVAAGIQALAAERHPGPVPPQDLAGGLAETIQSIYR